MSNLVLSSLESGPPVFHLKLGKDAAMLSSHRFTSLLNTIGKLFENILLPSILCEVSERELLRNEQFVFRPKHRT